LYVGYRYTEPKKWYNRLFYNFNANISSLFSPIGDIKSKYQQSNINVNMSAQMKKLHWFGIFTNFTPKQNDFYEPRITGNVFKRGASIMAGGWIESNYAKKYSVNAQIAERVFLNFYNLNGMDVFFSHQYRFNSKFSIRHSVEYQGRPTGLGFTTILANSNTPLFAIRTVNSIDHVLYLKYNFTNKMGLTFRARHYASVVKPREFFTLNSDGTLMPKKDVTENLSRNVNFFNIDMVYTWQFAPGSFLNVVWKEASIVDSNLATNNYIDNLQNTLQTEQNNNFSLKVIYFLDYLQLKQLKRKS
jgi:hypothetical protein